MTIRYGLAAFENDLRAILGRASDFRQIIEEARPLFRQLLDDDELVPEAYRQPLPDKYAQYLLYKPEDNVFSVVAFVWGPGQTAPVHDHLTWGLVGVWRGGIEEKRYRRTWIEDGRQEAYKLQEVQTVRASQGDISYVYPPDRDIHGVSNPFDDTAITVHVYGTDIGQQQRFIYDIDSADARPVVTRHANAQPIYAAGALPDRDVPAGRSGLRKEG
ncbi:cysteine dioxygenase family protein [Paenibacillus cisolokensis]|uniref:cysteine dioxygenase family protein n=1 Tax=Paenibacillus cisolokensis TaxID=1658519 RepID=UPI003D29AAFF